MCPPNNLPKHMLHSIYFIRILIIAVIPQTPTLDLPCIGWGSGRDLLSKFKTPSNPKSWIRAYKIIIYF